MNTLLDRTPVIVGVGEITQRTKDPAQAMEPLALMEAAIRAADQDAGGGLLTRVDSLDIVAEYSWPYADAPAQLSQRLQIQPARQTYGAVGGESPVRFIHEAALRIWRGETTVAVVVGAEANYAVAAAAKQKATLPWSPRDTNAKLVRGVDYLNPLAVRLGVASPPTVYPFYENAASAAWGQTPRQALAESGQLWAGCSAVASSNHYA
jgi:acetyl-CoA C-acetyltransferase